jgi:hypothetical protein
MDPIKPLDGLSELLRKQIAKEISTKSTSRSASKATEHQASHSSEEVTIEALRRKIALSIEAIQPDDPKRKQKIVKVFVESTLSWRFGTELLNDPNFYHLIDEVSQALEGEADMIESILTISHEK